MRIVHYLNQFFGGQGGEEAADMAPRIQDGAVGPGRLLEQVLGPNAHIVHTIIAGDNYGAEHSGDVDGARGQRGQSGTGRSVRGRALFRSRPLWDGRRRPVQSRPISTRHPRSDRDGPWRTRESTCTVRICTSWTQGRV